MSRIISIAAACWFFIAALSSAEPAPRGYHAEASVSAETRLDWVFALANQSVKKTPPGWLDGYDSTKQTYERFVPKNYNARRSYPLIVFISPGKRAAGYRKWQQACHELGVIFVSPHGAGNHCPMPRRMRIVLDVLDDVRRKYNIDPDRTYLAGFSGGGRVACSIGFALPEYFGGVIPICAGGELRQESWLRQRAVDRLSIAHLTGEKDFNRGEVERMRQPMLAGVGVRSRAWVFPKLGHGVPDSKQFSEVFRWLEQGLDKRRALAKRHPASRIADAPSREQWADRLFAEAKSRLKQPATVYSGLMQLKGVYVRWNDLPQAKAAQQLLQDYDGRPQRPWEADDIAEQRRFLIARARAVDGYASGPLPKQYAAQRTGMLQEALKMWRLVLQDGQDKAAAAEAKRRIPKLESLLKEKKK